MGINTSGSSGNVSPRQIAEAMGRSPGGHGDHHQKQQRGQSEAGHDDLDGGRQKEQLTNRARNRDQELTLEA
jgi:hypothetical protein